MGAIRLPSTNSPRGLLDQLQRLVARIDYKPGWRITCTSIETGIAIQVEHTAPDATGRSKEAVRVQTCEQIFVPDDEWDEVVVMQQIRRIVIGVEMHEVNEWLKLDGKCVVEPH